MPAKFSLTLPSLSLIESFRSSKKRWQKVENKMNGAKETTFHSFQGTTEWLHFPPAGQSPLDQPRKRLPHFLDLKEGRLLRKDWHGDGGNGKFFCTRSAQNLAFQVYLMPKYFRRSKVTVYRLFKLIDGYPETTALTTLSVTNWPNQTESNQTQTQPNLELRSNWAEGKPPFMYFQSYVVVLFWKDRDCLRTNCVRDKLSTCINGLLLLGTTSHSLCPQFFCGSMPEVIPVCGLIIATNYHFLFKCL